MKMFAAVASPGAGIVSGICIKSVESKDLLVRLVK
jgi:biotin carboxyl carrier protein